MARKVRRQPLCERDAAFHSAMLLCMCRHFTARETALTASDSCRDLQQALCSQMCQMQSKENLPQLWIEKLGEITFLAFGKDQSQFNCTIDTILLGIVSMTVLCPIPVYIIILPMTSLQELLRRCLVVR